MEKEDDNGSSISTPEIWKWEMAGKNRRWCCKGHTNKQPVPCLTTSCTQQRGWTQGQQAGAHQQWEHRQGLPCVSVCWGLGGQLHPTHTNPTTLLLSFLPKQMAMRFSSVRIIFIYFRANEQSAPQSQFNSSSAFCAVISVAELMHVLSYMLPTCSLENLWYQYFIT